MFAPLPAEWRLSIILLATLAFWMTDSLHGVRPVWVGLVSACLCLLPRVGFLNGEEFAAGVNVRTCIYLGGILGLAAVLAARLDRLMVVARNIAPRRHRMTICLPG